jgi:hypothetical protein
VITFPHGMNKECGEMWFGKCALGRSNLSVLLVNINIYKIGSQFCSP